MIKQAMIDVQSKLHKKFTMAEARGADGEPITKAVSYDQRIRLVHEVRTEGPARRP